MDESKWLSYADVVKKSVQTKSTQAEQVQTKSIGRNLPNHEKVTIKSWIEEIEGFEHDILVSGGKLDEMSIELIVIHHKNL